MPVLVLNFETDSNRAKFEGIDAKEPCYPRERRKIELREVRKSGAQCTFGVEQPADAGGKSRQSQMGIGSDFQTLPREVIKLRFSCRGGPPPAESERRGAL